MWRKTGYWTVVTPCLNFLPMLSQIYRKYGRHVSKQQATELKICNYIHEYDKYAINNYSSNYHIKFPCNKHKQHASTYYYLLPCFSHFLSANAVLPILFFSRRMQCSQPLSFPVFVCQRELVLAGMLHLSDLSTNLWPHLASVVPC